MNDIRKQLMRERKFHDTWAEIIDIDSIDVNVAFEGATAPENRYLLSQIGDLKGKYLLDIGCGAGESSVYFACKGAKCIAGDWSPGMVEASKKLAEKYNVNIEGRVINAMEIDFPENSFDIVYVSNILHHVDTEKALREIHRVLKTGGIACIWEPLRHNPIINVYRIIAKDFRTKDEHPLDIKIIEKMEEIFSDIKYDTFWFVTLWILLRFFIIERVNPNKERYWKKILYEENRLRHKYYRLEKFDNLIIKKIPFMKKYAWTIAIIAKK